MSGHASIGVDVGTGSARAGVFDGEGRLLGVASSAIGLWRPRPGWAQHDSADIWRNVAKAVRQAVAQSGAAPEDICGIGFDATCSLVLEGSGADRPCVDPDGAEGQDVIVWMDHRATDDAEAINAQGGAPLSYLGGRISPEMQLPKLRWLQRTMPDTFGASVRFWDLPDWLVYRACGATRRSLCSGVCKWTYLGHRGNDGDGWDDGFLANIGLPALTGEAGRSRIGAGFLHPGERAGVLSETSAAELGLRPGIAVAASLIDAYAGALGTLAADGGDGMGRLAVIAGTSVCHIALTKEPVPVPGVWGPYFNVLTQGSWALEGGQSAAGSLLDTILNRHAATPTLSVAAHDAGRSLHQHLAALLGELSDDPSTLTRDRHIQPDFHGNRSPLAEPWRLGAISGLSLDVGARDLLLDYLAALQAICYGTRHIIETMEASGAAVGELVMSGGLATSPLFLRELADVTGRDVLVPETSEPVLLGAAMLGSAAAADGDAAAAMKRMAPGATRTVPRGSGAADYHARKYAVFRHMQDSHAVMRAIMMGEAT